MGIWSRRLGMSFIVTLGLTLGRASAQAPLVPASQAIDPAPVTPLPVLLQRPVGPGPRPTFPLANRLGYLCGGDPEWFGCGNAATQWRFVFGSMPDVLRRAVRSDAAVHLQRCPQGIRAAPAGVARRSVAGRMPELSVGD